MHASIAIRKRVREERWIVAGGRAELFDEHCVKLCHALYGFASAAHARRTGNPPRV